MKGLSGIIFASFLIVTFSAQQTTAEVDLPERGLLTYRVVTLDEGADWMNLSNEVSDVVESQAHVYPSEREGKPAFIFEKDDLLRDGDRILWTFVLDTSELSLIRFEKKVTSRSGRVVAENWRDFQDPMYDFPKDGALCYIYTIPIWFMGKDLKQGARYGFNLLLSPEGMPIHMFAEVKGVETITMPAGTFECFRVILEPDLEKILGRWSWAKPIINPFVPDYDFWVHKAPPHFQVRFEGKFGPVGAAPTQAYELIAVQITEVKNDRHEEEKASNEE